MSSKFLTIASLICSTFAAPHLPPTPLVPRITDPEEHDTVLGNPYASGQRHLLPAVHWDHDSADFHNLEPHLTHSLYYSSHGISTPAIEHTFAKVDTSLVKDAVVLGHSKYVKSVTCEAKTVVVSFTDAAAYEFAKNAWSSVPDFMLVTYSHGCGTRPQERSYWEVNNLHFDEQSLAIFADVDKELGSSEAMDAVDMSWGTWNAAKQEQGLPSTFGASKVDKCSASSYVNHDGLSAMACHDENFDTNLDHAKQERLGRRENRLQRRISWDDFKSGLTSVVHDVGAVVQNGASTALNAVGNFASSTVGVIKQAADIVEYSPAPDFTIPIDVAAPADKTVNQPFENSYLIYKADKKTTNGEAALDVYCVDCHLKGTLHFAGHATFKLGSGLTQLYVDSEGFLDAQVAIGIDAHAEYGKDFTKDIIKFTAPPPAGFSVDDIFRIGPFFSLSAKADFKVEAAGQVIAGLHMSVPQFTSHIDFLNSDNSKSSGFTPEFTKIFHAEGQISAQAGISLPVAVGIGITISPIDFNKNAELVDQPGLTARLSYSTTDDDCNGIKYNIDAENHLFFNAFDAAQFPLSDYSHSLAEGCYGGTQTTTTASPSTSPSAEPSATVNTDLVNTNQDLTPSVNVAAAGVRIGANNAKNNFTYSQETSNDFNQKDYNQFQKLANHSEHREAGSEGAYPNGTDFINIQDTSNQYRMVSDESGNLRPARPSDDLTNRHFVELRGVVFGDTDGRYLHYYVDEMKTYNVSRIRMTRLDDAPSTAKFIGFVPAPDKSNSTYLYAATDTDGAAYAIITCNYPSQASKIFIAKDGQKAAKILSDASLQDSVTGGTVTTCVNIPWKVPGNAGGKFVSGKHSGHGSGWNATKSGWDGKHEAHRHKHKSGWHSHPHKLRI